MRVWGAGGAVGTVARPALALLTAMTLLGVGLPAGARQAVSQTASAKPTVIRLSFAPGKASVSEAARAIMLNKLELLQSAATVTVSGYSQLKAGKSQALSLSKKRANAVANHLRKLGLVANLKIAAFTSTAKSTSSLPSDRVDLSFRPTGGLIWSQDFNGADGSAVDPRYFTALTGDGQAELGLPQYGTGEIELNSPTAATLDGAGNLRISTSVTNGVWRSARIWTAQKLAIHYGSIEVRAKFPAGSHNWPAIWMLGNNYQPPNRIFGTTPWPNSGEIDLIEVLQSNTEARSTLHGNTLNGTDAWRGGAGVSALAPLPDISGGFHTWRMDWKPNQISFYLDGLRYATNSFDGRQITQTLETGETTRFDSQGVWPFNEPFFLIINNAIPRRTFAPEGTTSQFLIDYVHIAKFEGLGEVIRPKN